MAGRAIGREFKLQNDCGGGRAQNWVTRSLVGHWECLFSTWRLNEKGPGTYLNPVEAKYKIE